MQMNVVLATPWPSTAVYFLEDAASQINMSFSIKVKVAEIGENKPLPYHVPWPSPLATPPSYP